LEKLPPTELLPLETFVDRSMGGAIPLPATLARLYGTLRFRAADRRPYVFANFAETIDGVVELGPPGPAGGAQVTGSDRHDRMIMGMLRALADAIVVGAGTLRSVPHHRWSPARVFPTLSEEFRSLRDRLGKPGEPLQVIVTGTGNLPVTLPVFRSREAPSMVVTTEQGANRLRSAGLPESVTLRAVSSGSRVMAETVLAAVRDQTHGDRVLVEGGPNLLADFVGESLVDELFLTLAPQIAGREEGHRRPGLVEGRQFGPEDPRWATLLSAKGNDRLLFLRYAFVPRSPRNGKPVA
jgi:riboflavin biosynthesis pyrimidine reductase